MPGETATLAGEVGGRASPMVQELFPDTGKSEKICYNGENFGVCSKKRKIFVSNGFGIWYDSLNPRGLKS
jgi:hypothetical protein